jgi:uncharacterized protein YifE (UPF0438 family)
MWKWKIGIISVSTEANLSEKFQLRQFRHAENKLSWKQKRILRKYGKTMEALGDGTGGLLSSKGEHFVDMCNDLVEPNDEYETAWKTYQNTLVEEERLKELYREELRDSPKREEYLRSRYS